VTSTDTGGGLGPGDAEERRRAVLFGAANRQERPAEFVRWDGREQAGRQRDVEREGQRAVRRGHERSRQLLKLAQVGSERLALRHERHGTAETETYLAHHLKLTGRSDTLVSDDAADLILQVSRGLPRAVNNLAIQALIAAFATNKSIVDEASARAAVTEVTTD
jgi:type II secretory pathway predicted ATPase ExeA